MANQQTTSPRKITPSHSDQPFNKAQWDMLMSMFANRPSPFSTEKLSVTNKSNSLNWMIDSGASHHMTGDQSRLTSLFSISPCAVHLPNGHVEFATHAGEAIINEKFTLTYVLLVPHLQCHLISVARLISDLNCIVSFDDKLCSIQDRHSRIQIGVGNKDNGVYYLRGTAKIEACSVNVETCPPVLWHRRMGHPSAKIVRMLSTAFSTSNISKFDFHDCDVCFRAKQTRETFSLSNARAIKPFELLHCDVWGPYRYQSTCGAYYFLTSVDDYSRAVWIFLMASKAEVNTLVQNFFNMVHTQFQGILQVFRSDNGTEFKPLIPFFRAKGVIYQTSCPYTPQQNGRVERKHRHILEVARALRFQASLPIQFWGECVLIAGYLINRTPSVLNNGKTPYELIYGKPPSYDHLRVFGCLCYVYQRNGLRDKFLDRSAKCVFLGYSHNQKGWRVYDIERGCQYISRDVKFLEDQFPFAVTERADMPETTPRLLCDSDFDYSLITLKPTTRNPHMWLILSQIKSPMTDSHQPIVHF